MCKLSVIIVSYNVRFFLEQALRSVQRASEKMGAEQVEVIVVDNASQDGSPKMVREKFPEVQLLANKENTGFAKANNQAISQARGRYILLLNPDTVIPEDTFTTTIRFMGQNPEAGALGVKMLDGKGHYLPESKRAFPEPATAFYKLFGLAALFPRSPRFARYYLGHLTDDKTHEVEVLSGAFMLLRKAALDKSGMLDERFFMYGEDIDLSYRILQAGYKNYYFPHIRIIHYKGESTRKGSLNYVRLFYKAMALFARKHLSTGQARLFHTGVQAAIWLRAGWDVLLRFSRKLTYPMTDMALIYLGVYLVKDYWEKNHRFVEGGAYPSEFMLYMVPGYIVCWLTGIFFSGGYDKDAPVGQVVRGVLAGTLGIAVVYAFLPEAWRFSRAIILLSAAWTVFALAGYRLLIHFWRHRTFSPSEARDKKTVIAGAPAEVQRVLTLLNRAGAPIQYIGQVAVHNPVPEGDDVLGHLDELEDIASIYEVDEVIFCGRDIPAGRIIEQMTRMGTAISYKIVPEHSFSIIGSNSIHHSGELYAVEVNVNLARPSQQRNKRLFDLGATALVFLLIPVIGLIQGPKKAVEQLKNSFSVLTGRKTWVGYAPVQHDEISGGLPPLPAGIFSPLAALEPRPNDPKTIARLNLFYAKDYNVRKDCYVWWQGLWKGA